MFRHRQSLLSTPMKPRGPSEPPDVHGQWQVPRRLAGIASLFLALIFLAVCLLACDVNVILSPPNPPPPLSTPTSVVVIQKTPTPAPTPPPTPTPSPTLPPQPTATSTPTITAADVSIVGYTYKDRILKGSDSYYPAYNMLSTQQKQNVSFGQFEHDPNYTLYPGCWTVIRDVMPSLEKDGVTWEVGIVFQYVPYGGGHPQTYYWHFQIRMQQGSLVIVGIGLTATSIDTTTTLTC